MAGGKFNYRVCGILLSGGKLLAMRDERSPYYYLPGGRVRLGETAEAALLREMGEELGIAPRLVRPLWLHQSFFTEDVDGLNYHELCLYFLLDAGDTDLPARGETFTRTEGEQTLRFQWLPLERLGEEYFYPLFLKEEILRLPDHLTLLTTCE